MTSGTFFGEFLGKTGSVLLLESECTPGENELRRRYAKLHPDQAVQGESQGKMGEDLLLGCWPIYPSPACHLGHVPLPCSFLQLFQYEAEHLFASMHDKVLSPKTHIRPLPPQWLSLQLRARRGPAHELTHPRAAVTGAAWGHSLCRELVGAHGDAVHELHGAPEPVELHALVHVHDPVGGGRPAPDGVLQVAPDPRQDHLEHGEPTAQPLLGQQVPLPGDGYLLRRGTTRGTQVRT